MPCLAVIKGGVIFWTGGRINACEYILVKSGKDWRRPESESLSEEADESGAEAVLEKAKGSSRPMGLGDEPRLDWFEGRA